MSKRNEFLAQYGHDGHIDAALSGDDVNVRCAAMRNHGINKDQLDKGLSDDFNIVRATALDHPKITKEQARKLSYDKSNFVKNRANDVLRNGAR